MTAPVISAVTFDKAAYAPGDTITVTVTYSDPNTSGGTAVTHTYTIAGTVTDSATGAQSAGSATFTVSEGGTPVANSATASVAGGQAGQVWTEVSDDHKAKAVFTAVAEGTATANTVTVANPGAQSGTVGTAVSVQLTATDSGSGAKVAFTAAGLPAGLAVSSGGLITGTPTAAGTSTVTVTATDDTQATGSASFPWTVEAAPAPASAVVPLPTALSGHTLVHEYDPAELYTWRYLPGTTTPPTNGSGVSENPASPRNVTLTAGNGVNVIEMATTDNTDCGIIQSPATFPTASGVIEALIKFSGFQNSAGHVFADWSSLWMYGANWPTDGEIDAVEVSYGNNYVSYHYGTNGQDTEATTDPWTYPAKQVQLQPENSTTVPVAPNIVPDAWTVVDMAFGKDSSGNYYVDVYYNGTLYTHIDGAYVTGKPMLLTAGAGFGAAVLGSNQTPYDQPGNIQIQYIRVFS